MHTRLTNRPRLQEEAVEADKIVDARERTVGRNKVTVKEFLVRFKGQRPQMDQWVREKHLAPSLPNPEVKLDI